MFNTRPGFTNCSRCGSVAEVTKNVDPHSSWFLCPTPTVNDIAERVQEMTLCVSLRKFQLATVLFLHVKSNVIIILWVSAHRVVRSAVLRRWRICRGVVVVPWFLGSHVASPSFTGRFSSLFRGDRLCASILGRSVAIRQQLEELHRKARLRIFF